MHRIAPRSIAPGAKWTAVRPTEREKHFEVVRADRDRVELRCVVTDGQRAVGRAELANPDAWLPGWR